MVLGPFLVLGPKSSWTSDEGPMTDSGTKDGPSTKAQARKDQPTAARRTRYTRRVTAVRHRRDLDGPRLQVDRPAPRRAAPRPLPAVHWAPALRLALPRC